MQAARLHERPLDMSRPLWELYVIEGLDDIDGVPPGALGFVLKLHHAAVDGKSGNEMITAIHSQTPKAEDPPPPARPSVRSPPPPRPGGPGTWRSTRSGPSRRGSVGHAGFGPRAAVNATLQG